MPDGYQVDPARLDQIAKGLQGLQDQLQGVGTGYGATVGSGFANLSLTPGDLGHADMASAWGDFASELDFENRLGVLQVSGIIDKLGGTSRLYEQTEGYASNVLKDVYADGLGNPHLSDQQVEGKSWKDVAADNPISQIADVGHGYSLDAARQAGDQIGQTWSGEWDDLQRTNIQRAQDTAGMFGQSALPNQAPPAEAPDDRGDASD